MGQQISYEVGMANIGRMVKVYKENSGRQHGMAAKLLGGTQKAAEVQVVGHREKRDSVAWTLVCDWTSHNATPLAPARPKAIQMSEVKLMPTSVPAAPIGPIESTMLDPFSVYAGLGGKIASASAEVSAAEDLLDTALEQVHACRAAHAEALEVLNGIRRQAAAALAQIDAVLGGTTAATRPQNGVVT